MGNKSSCCSNDSPPEGLGSFRVNYFPGGHTNHCRSSGQRDVSLTGNISNNNNNGLINFKNNNAKDSSVKYLYYENNDQQHNQPSMKNLTNNHKNHYEIYDNVNRDSFFDDLSHSCARKGTSTNLQHISEREPDDIDQDPSTHPTKGPIFMERSKSEIKIRDNRLSMYFLNGDSAALTPPILNKSINFRNDLERPPMANILVKSSSCSTIFLDDSTISQPNLKNTIKCIALAIYYHIANRRNRGNERLMDIFEERKHPICSDPIPIDYELKDPEHKHIYRFIRVLFSSAQLTAECAIITLVYIERLLTYAEIDLCPSNWRRVVLGAIILASKVWDDQAVWNVDYCQILRRCTVDDMNELERQFLECVEFNINVPSSVYAKYYFDLRTLAIANDLQLPLQPLYKERAKKLEALSRIYEDKYADVQKRSIRRWNSVDRLNHASSKSPVVIP